MKVNFLDLQGQYHSIKSEIDSAIQEVLEKCAFAAGPYVKSFEEHFAIAHQARYCAGVNSGTAALHIALMALEIGRGDEVIVPANTFFATPEAVSLAGATPVFVDHEPEYFNIDPHKIEKAITPRTRAIIAVNLYGQPAQLDKIKALAEKHHLLLIEDCAQSHLASLNGRSTGTFGICGCFSFYPGKNLGAYGEGGAVITNDEGLYKKIMMLRDHGSAQKYHHDLIGHNYRLEGIQGAILDVKLKHLPQWTETRRQNAGLYRKYLAAIPEVAVPQEMPGARHVYHIFCVRVPRRDELIKYLAERQIYTGIHYPIPCHMQKAYASLGYKSGDFPVSEQYAGQLLSLPMSEMLTEEQIVFVSATIKEFFAA
ncbi:MAG TPA: DegT/DnrJ/EryC1/StrS family aminotransferase [bacterium]|nr:DegT/DnrJ/EryC1/StrS family aminotransferase [bacterium]HQG46024.1 DegT/DnrJ/EryC1/StrS family aminotransferase [bacterium]HQI47704.1 DegT/DnrJ/EryC1/StrS family aminotransferase [bacterium]HQJ63477.1 DegT/DnrJ/EryC1/StrS family aminotransferase [bacterium]